MNEKIPTENKLAYLPISKLLWIYSLPAIIGIMVSSLYNVIDRIFIGHGVGPLALSGLTLTFPFMNLLFAFGMLIGVGASTRISIRLGENNHERANKVLANATMLTLIISIIVVIITRIFMTDILMLFGGSDQTVTYAEDFMKIIIPATIINLLNFTLNNIMRSSGYPKKAMLTMFISAGVNVILAPIFIFWFHWGIQGAAWATTIAMTVSCTWVVLHFFKSSSTVHFQRKYFVFEKDIIKSIVSIGLTPFSMQLALSAIIVIVNIGLIKYGGDLAVGAYGIISSVTMLVIMFVVGINQGAQPIIGFNYGAAKYDQMFKTLHFSAIGATVISTLGFVLGYFFPETIIHMFTTDVGLIHIAANGLRIVVLVFPIVGISIVFSNFFMSIGKAKIAMFLTLTRQVFFLIPLLLILPHFYGLNGVWFAMPVSDALSAIVIILTLFLFIQNFRKREYR